MARLEELLEKAERGLLSDSERDGLAQILQESDDSESIDNAIAVLGADYAVQYKSEIAKFLDYVDDNIVPGTALRVLCIEWGYSDEYLDKIKHFIDGSDWDYDGYVRLIALQAAKEFFEENFDVELVEKVLTVFEDEEEGEPIRAEAYFILGRLAGKSDSELPGVFDKLDFEHGIDRSILERVRNIVQRKLI